MRKFRRLALLMVATSISIGLAAQNTVSSYPTLTANNGSGGVTFEIISTTNIEIISTTATLYSGTLPVQVWYRLGGALHPSATTPSISPANGWVLHETVTAVGNGSTPVPVPLTNPIIIQGGMTYGFAIGNSSTTSRYMTYSAALPSTFTDGILTMNTGVGSGWGGTFPNPTIATRSFVGSLTYKVSATAENDAGVVSIDGPNNCEGINQVQATIKNHGINQVNSVMVKWEVNGLPQPDVIYNNVLDTFGGVFPQSAQIVLGDVTLINGLTTDIVAWTEMPNNQIDTVTENDTAYKTIDALPTISAFPFSENFEGGQGDWFIDGTNSSWAFGTPAKTTISGASSGVNAFVTGGLGTGFHNDDEKSYVNSPCFDLSGFEGTPWVALDVWWNIELGWDGAALQATTDGNNWQTVGKTDDPYNWYTDSTLEGKPGDQDHGWSGRTSEANTGSGGWVNAKHGLDESFVDQVVRFRVAMGSDAATVDDGIAFDDFRIVDYKNANLGPDKRSLCQTSSMSLDPEVNFNGKIWWSTLDSTNQTIVVTTTGSYWVTYTDTLIDLTSTDTVEIIQSPPLVIDWTKYQDTIYLDASTTLNPNTPLDVDYTWTPGGYTFPYFVVRGIDFGPGTHQFVLNVVDSVLCSDQKTVTIEILNATGLGENETGTVRIYPNPANDVINIELDEVEGTTLVQIVDMNGRVARELRLPYTNSRKSQIDISDLNSGAYIVRLMNGDRSLIHQIIKQ